ncbi:hypothetical protein IWX90DRAFT_270465 [Phyllosticta citrichinensis]|uniref:G-protein coupled receptors family 2 profile 2 domain-containing protein n=1 Tax=Phyllosticta citrichinensis TaxID=1130410 RepID=A0ABR1XMR7_9PEZI
MIDMTPQQEYAIEVVERVMSSISLASTLFIILTFTAFPSFRKPINRLVVYASVGNILVNIATIVSVSAIPTRGGSPELCRFQGFFIQMFMPADSLWTLCMALNVYLTFFHNYNAEDLRNLEVTYAICCYGIPFIPSLIYLILDLSADKGIYGPAVLWCWVSSGHEWMRIAFFYVPVWVVIGTTLIIYASTGKVICRQRNALQAFAENSNHAPVIENPFTAVNSNGVTRVTEIQVTSESIQDPAEGDRSGAGSRSSFTSTRDLGDAANPIARPEHALTRTPTTGSWKERWDANQNTSSNGQAENAPGSTSKAPWITETEQFRASISAGRPLPRDLLLHLEGHRPNNGAARKNSLARVQANRAAWSYAKVSFLMFLALFIVWVPSTVNRIYAIAHPTKPNFALNAIAAGVLPLQGFWNFCMYIATSRTQCKDAYIDIRDGVTVWYRRKFNKKRPGNRFSKDAQSVFSSNGRKRLGSNAEGVDGEKSATIPRSSSVRNETSLSRAVSVATTAKTSPRPPSTATSRSTFSISNISPAGYYMPKPRGSRSSPHKDIPSARTPATVQEQLRLKALQTSPTKSSRSGSNRRSELSTTSSLGKRVPLSPSVPPMSPRSIHSFATNRSLHAVSEVEGEEPKETNAKPTGKRKVNRARTVSTSSRDKELPVPPRKRASTSTLTMVTTMSSIPDKDTETEGSSAAYRDSRP